MNTHNLGNIKNKNKASKLNNKLNTALLDETHSKITIYYNTIYEWIAYIFIITVSNMHCNVIFIL